MVAKMLFAVCSSKLSRHFATYGASQTACAPFVCSCFAARKHNRISSNSTQLKTQRVASASPLTPLATKQSKSAGVNKDPAPYFAGTSSHTGIQTQADTIHEETRTSAWAGRGRATNLFRERPPFLDLLLVLLVVRPGLHVCPRLHQLGDGLPVLPEPLQPHQEIGVFLLGPPALARRRRLAPLLGGPVGKNTARFFFRFHEMFVVYFIYLVWGGS